MTSIDLTPKLTVGTHWKQERPTLSSPVGYRILRNDAHPHRKGKTASIRVADLLRKYQAVSA